MHFSTTFVALFAAISPLLEANAAPLVERQSSTNGLQGYSSRLQRKEWRKLTNAEKTSYLNAVKCLQGKPATKTLRGSKTLYEQFVAVHLDLVDKPEGDTIHIVGQFLPWHRYFLYIYEQNLRSKCGYTGTQPYWNWSLDAAALSKSPIFDATYGFGGNGTVPKKILYPYTGNITFIPPAPGVIRPTGNCVSTGPFASSTSNVGPGNFQVNHCLARNIQNTQGESFNQKMVDTCMAKTNYLDFWLCLELAVGVPGNEDFHLNSMHAGLHIAVGEELMNMASSPNDPLFYMHHANLDRIWDQWQKKSAAVRTYQIQGFSDPAQTKNATLNTPLAMVGLAADGIVRWVMNTTALNYEYI